MVADSPFPINVFIGWVLAEPVVILLIKFIEDGFYCL
jgi:hypothetical protein